jgi:hypothetical protein
MERKNKKILSFQVMGITPLHRGGATLKAGCAAAHPDFYIDVPFSNKNCEHPDLINPIHHIQK